MNTTTKSAIARKGAAILLLLATGCTVISYSVDPEVAWRAERLPRTHDDTLYYEFKRIEGLTFGGEEELRDLLRAPPVFPRGEPTTVVPESGVFVRVDNTPIRPSTGALVYGYIDAGLLFALPLYSDSSGHILRFDVFKDGAHVKTYEYTLKRQIFIWLPALVVAWANAFTADEEDAFVALTKQFFIDATRDGVL